LFRVSVERFSEACVYWFSFCFALLYIWLITPFQVSISYKGYHGKSQYLFA